MKRLLTIIITLAAVASSIHSQVITNMAKENTKIEKGEKPGSDEDRLSVQPMDIQLDSTATYYVMIDSAQACIKNQDWNGAENYIRKAIAAEPHNNTNSMLLSNLATLQRYQGKLSEAIKNYTLALDMTPNAVTLLLNRAAVYMQTGDIEAATNDFLKVRALDDKDMESRYSLGMLAVNMHDFDKAEMYFKEMKAANSKSALANEGLGMLAKEKGEYAKAALLLSEAIKSDNNPTLLGHRADCYLVLKQLNNAAEDIQNALEQTPEDGFLYLLRAKLNKLRFNKEDMKRDLELAVKYGVDKEVANALKD